MVKVVAISAGMLVPKKGSEEFRKAHRYLNYGLLGLASMLDEHVPVLHGNFSPVGDFVLENMNVLDADEVLLSIPSFYAVPWAKQLIDYLSACGRRPAIHVGGRWVVDHNYEYLRNIFPDWVHLYRGLGEEKVRSLAKKWRSPCTFDGEGGSRTPPLNYSLLANRHEFHPSIEVSRGCGLKCAFCEEANEPLMRLKSPDDIMDEMRGALLAYQRADQFYFESSNFAPSWDWVNAFRDACDRYGDIHLWRTESRVDVLSPKKVIALAETGLKVLDLGLESASEQQLLRMGKTKKPKDYIAKAAALLEACKSVGVRVKVNILLYPGETLSTIQETTAFLADRRDAIFGVSTYPVIAYGTGKRLEYFRDLYRSQGATGITETTTEGVWEVDLSTEVSSGDAKNIAVEIAQDFMRKENYFYMKSFSYLNPAYTWEKFEAEVRVLPRASRPFGS